MMRLRTPTSPTRQRGFIMIETMVVVLILGLVILIVSGWGAPSRLESAGNSMVTQVISARDQAILEGYDSHMEIGTDAKWSQDSSSQEKDRR